MKVLNSHLENIKIDYLYHLGLDTSMDLKGMFGDTKFVVMGGSAVRAERFAKQLQEELYPDNKDEIKPIGKTERYSLFKVGKVISVNHGMGMPSISILLHELTKLLHYAEASDVFYIRVGTSGGVGVEGGTVVVTKSVVNDELDEYHVSTILGQRKKFPSFLQNQFVEEFINLSIEKHSNIPVVVGKTLGTNCFYEGQGRIDGAICDYNETDKMEFLQKLHGLGVRNIEMESGYFAAFCNRLDIPALIICSALINRLNGDQVTSTSDELKQFSENAQILTMEFIKEKLK